MKISIYNPPIASYKKILTESYEKSLKIIKKSNPEIFKILDKAIGIHLNLYFISDDEIQELNNQFRKKNAPTDVLSWGYINNDLQDNEAFGEIYISTQTATKKAEKKQITLKEEILFLFVHGLLHVFDYDHNNDQEEDEMNQITAEILKELQLDATKHI